MKNSTKPKSIEILNIKKDVPNDVYQLQIDFCDSSINEYKIYDCKTLFNDGKEVINSITIYYNQKNYIYCGDGNHSVEIIFSNFLNKKITNDDCIIEYDGIKYSPKEDFGILTRKRINFINVNIHQLKFPRDINDREVNINTKDNKNFLISISVVNKPKIIAIYLNEPFLEPKFIQTEKELINILKNTLEKISKIIYVGRNEDYIDYYNRCNHNVLEEYGKEIKNSFDIEKKIINYFCIYRENLTKEQIELYDLYSEFMTYFPDLELNISNITEKDISQYYHQYYFSKTSIIKFYNKIPEKVNESDKVKLKYSACKCLRNLLKRGYGINSIELFDFIDFTEKNTIYYDANLYNRKFVEYLSEKSEIFLFFLQINSGSSINLLSNELTGRISMIDEKTIKKNLISTIPKYGIKILDKSPFNTYTLIETRITCIYEESIFNKRLNNYYISSKNDIDFNIRYLLANLLQREDFGHLNSYINFFAFDDKNTKRPFSLNYSEVLCPHKYYMINKEKEEMKEIVKVIGKNENNEIIIRGDAGIALNFFLTRGKYKLMKVLRKVGIDFSELFNNPNLQTSEDLTKYINILNQLYLDYHRLFKYDIDDEVEYKTRFEDSEDLNPIPYGIPRLEKFF